MALPGAECVPDWPSLLQRRKSARVTWFSEGDGKGCVPCRHVNRLFVNGPPGQACKAASALVKMQKNFAPDRFTFDLHMRSGGKKLTETQPS